MSLSVPCWGSTSTRRHQFETQDLTPPSVRSASRCVPSAATVPSGSSPEPSPSPVHTPSGGYPSSELPCVRAIGLRPPQVTAGDVAGSRRPAERRPRRRTAALPTSLPRDDLAGEQLRRPRDAVGRAGDLGPSRDPCRCHQPRRAQCHSGDPPDLERGREGRRRKVCPRCAVSRQCELPAVAAGLHHEDARPTERHGWHVDAAVAAITGQCDIGRGRGRPGGAIGRRPCLEGRR